MATAAVSFEFRIFDDAFIVHFDLQAHHVAAGGRADHAGVDGLVVLSKVPTLRGFS